MKRLWSAPSVADAQASGADNFMLIRLILALAVIVSHAFSVPTGNIGDEPLYRSTSFTLGEHAVNGFFAVSGFLVTMSYVNRGARDYALARLLRIYPGLIAAVLVVTFGFGLALTRLDARTYLAEPGTYSFIWASVSTFKSAAALPGLFEGNLLRYPLATVWTLKYEVLCYLGVLALGLAGLLGKRAVLTAGAAALALALIMQDWYFPAAGKALQTNLRLPFLFLCGGLMHLWREKLPVSLPLAALLALATIALAWTPLFRAAMFSTEAYGLVALALSPRVTGLVPQPQADLSYGTYLYGWPVQQALHMLAPGLALLPGMACAILAALALAALSWFAVEKPALEFKRRLLAARAGSR